MLLFSRNVAQPGRNFPHVIIMIIPNHAANGILGLASHGINVSSVLLDIGI